MSLSLNGLIAYLNTTKIIDQSTDAPAVMSGSKKTYQTRFAFMHARSLLRTLAAGNTTPEEQAILDSMIHALSAVPESPYDIRAFFKLLNQFESIVNSITTSCEAWLLATGRSGDLTTTRHFIHALHFLFLTLEGDIEIDRPNQDKKIGCGPFTKVVIPKERKRDLHQNVTRLLRLCPIKLAAIQPAINNDNTPSPRKTLFEKANKVIETSKQIAEGHYLSHTKRLLPDLRGCITEFTVEIERKAQQLATINRLLTLNTFIEEGASISQLLKNYTSEEQFNQLMIDLNLTNAEQASWKAARAEYQWAHATSFFTYYARSPLSYLGIMSESPLSLPQIQAYLNQQVNHLYNHTKVDTQTNTTATPSNKLTRLAKGIQQDLTYFKHARDSLSQLKTDLNQRSYIQVRQTIAAFCRFPNIFAYIVSAKYRSCFHQARAIYSTFFQNTPYSSLDPVDNPANHFEVFKPIFSLLQENTSSGFFTSRAMSSLARREYFRDECNMSQN